MIKKSANYNRLINSDRIYLFPYIALRDHYARSDWESSYVLSIAAACGGINDYEDICVFCSMLVHDPADPDSAPEKIAAEFARLLFHSVQGDGMPMGNGHVEVFRAIACLLTFEGIEVLIPEFWMSDDSHSISVDWVTFEPNKVHERIAVLDNKLLAENIEPAIDFSNEDINKLILVDEIIERQENENALIGPKERRDRERHEAEVRKMVREEREREDQIRITQMIDSQHTLANARKNSNIKPKIMKLA